MKVVWNWPLSPGWGESSIYVNGDGKFLNFAMKNQSPHVWFEVDPHAAVKEWAYLVAPSGEPIDTKK